MFFVAEHVANSRRLRGAVADGSFSAGPVTAGRTLPVRRLPVANGRPFVPGKTFEESFPTSIGYSTECKWILVTFIIVDDKIRKGFEPTQCPELLGPTECVAAELAKEYVIH